MPTLTRRVPRKDTDKSSDPRSTKDKVKTKNNMGEQPPNYDDKVTPGNLALAGTQVNWPD